MLQPVNIIWIVAVRVFYNGIRAKRCLVEVSDATEVVFSIKVSIVGFAKPICIYANKNTVRIKRF